MSKNLLQDRRFLPIFITQFLGCFNDCLIKNAFVILVTYKIAQVSFLSASQLVSLANFLFMLPFIILGSIAGQVADKYEKSFLIKIIKAAEIVISVVSIWAFFVNSIPALLACIFFMGVHSTFFGTLKFSLLPDKLNKAELAVANAYIEASTFIGIMIGTIAGGLYTNLGDYVLIALFVCAIIGYISSCYIEKSPILDDNLVINYNIWQSNINVLKYAYYKKNIFFSILGISWFWLIGTLFLIQLPLLCRESLFASESVVNFFFMLFSIGVAVGCLAYSRIFSGCNKISHSIILLCALAFVGIDLYYAVNNDYYQDLLHIQELKTFFTYGNNIRIAVELFLIAMIAGAYVLPLYTNMQYFSPAHYRSRIIAANNIINSFFILGGIFFIMLLSFLGFSVASILLMACLCNFLVALYIFKLNSAKGLWKKKIVRKIFRGLLRLLYSVEIKGLENFNREKKGAIIICNHFSFIDPTLLATYVSENIIFGIYTTYHKAWWMQPFLRLIKTIPIDPYNSFGIKNLIKIAASGHNVGIFPEGRISTTGNLMKIYGGPAMIAARTHGTILPIVISGADKTYFTRYKLQKLKFFPKITITIFPSININELVIDNDRLALMRTMSKIMYETIIMAHHDDNSSSLSHALTIAEEACGSSHVILQDHKKQFNYHSLNNIVGQVANSLLNVIKYQSNVAVLLDNSLDSIIFFLALEKLNCKILLLEHELSLEQKASFLKEHNAANLFIADHIYKSSDHIAEFFVANGFVCSAIGEIIKVGKKHYSALRLGNVASKIYSAKDVRIFFASGDKLLGFSWRDIKFAINIFRVKYPFSYKDITFHNISLSNYYGLVYATILPLISGMRIFSHNIYNKQSLIAEVIYDNGPTVIFSDNNRLNYYIANSQNYDFYKTSIIFVNNVDLATKEAWDIKYSHSLMNIYTSDLGIVVAANNSFSYHKDSLGAILPFFTITNKNELHINRPLISKIILLGGQSVEMNSYSYKLSSSLRISEDGNIFQG